MSRILGGAVVALLMGLVVGCGTAAPTGASSPSNAPAASSSANTAPVTTATVTVGGKSETVLTNASGYTLYYYDKDTPTSSACTGSCAGIWPAVTTSASKLSSPSGLGPFSVLKDANGSQVEYKGHPLYTYTGDTAPGQANGQGKFGLWWVVTPAVATAAQGTGATSSSSGGGW
ncbi:MAG: COG4315 family predicted lipoprotein [Clostridia bacterium]